MSIRSASFFGKSRLPLHKFLLLFYMWAQDYDNKQVAHELKLDTHTVVDWLHRCRLVCLRYCNDHKSIGGKVRIIEIDETCICKRKYNRGRKRIGSKQWIFGGIERGIEGKAFAFEFPNCKKKTLLKLIRKHIRRGTTIISDDWPAYRKLGKQLGKPVGYKHYVICHKKVFARSEADLRIHTNKVEGFWMHVKHKIKRLRGTSSEHISSYVAEAVFRQHCNVDKKNVLYALFEVIATINYSSITSL